MNTLDDDMLEINIVAVNNKGNMGLRRQNADDDFIMTVGGVVAYAMYGGGNESKQWRR